MLIARGQLAGPPRAQRSTRPSWTWPPALTRPSWPAGPLAPGCPRSPTRRSSVTSFLKPVKKYHSTETAWSHIEIVLTNWTLSTRSHYWVLIFCWRSSDLNSTMAKDIQTMTTNVGLFSHYVLIMSSYDTRTGSCVFLLICFKSSRWKWYG